MGERIGRKALKLALAASLLAATAGKAESAPKGPRKKPPQTSSWQAPKAPETSSWNAEIQKVQRDFDEILDEGRHMNFWRTALDTYQTRLRTEPQLLGNAATLRNLADHPECFFDMLNDETKQRIRDITDKRNVWLTKGIANPTTQALGSIQQESIRRSAQEEYGQGVAVQQGGKYFLVTNLHIVNAIDPRSQVRVAAGSLGGDDVGFYEISKENLRRIGVNLRYVEDLDAPLPQDFKLQGAPVVSRAFDPDASEPFGPRIETGVKEEFGIANHAAWLSDRVAPNSAARQELLTLYAYIADRGEADERDTRGTRITPTPANRHTWHMYDQGTSGSAVDMYVGGTWRLAGIVSRAVHPIQNIDGRDRDFAIKAFVPRDRIIAALKDARRIFAFPSPRMTQAKM